MNNFPSRQDQIIQTHANLIVHVVKAIQNRALLPQLEEALETSAKNGWTNLVTAIRNILNGRRDQSLLAGLDDEDAIIIEAILRGIQNPATLPDPAIQANSTLAASGLASMLHQAGKGNVEALQTVANMAEQMMKVGGDMGRLGGLMKRLIDGERDADVLCQGMSAHGESLLISILNELGKLERH